MAKGRKTKDVYVFVLEGLSDKAALAGILQRLYRNKKIFPVVMYCDITSDCNVDVKKVGEEIEKQIKQKLKEEKILKEDVTYIFQICDTDGAFIPNSAIVQGTEKGLVYTPSQILASDINGAVERNKHKKAAVSELLTKKKIMGKDYKLFFMSCNLDHVLYNIQNLEYNKKTNKAYEFFGQFVDCPDDFIPFITKCAFGVPSNYNESWKYIMDGLHSLERHNNFFIFFNEHFYYAV